MNENKIGFSMNSREYWDDRFEGDWEAMQGKEQTAFFAQIALKLMPLWLKEEITSEKLTICDFGCALGQAVDLLHNSFQTEVCGVDFSEQAVVSAQNLFSQYRFIQKDIVSGDMSGLQFDIGYISNVLEHIPSPWKAAENISQCISRYLIIMIPFREMLNINEHCNKFDSVDIPLVISKLKLVYVHQKDCADMEKTQYPDRQILLVYSRNGKALDKVSLDDFIQSFEEDYRLQLNRDSNRFNKLVSELEDTHNVYQHNIQTFTESFQKQNDILSINVHEKQRQEEHNLRLENELHTAKQEKQKQEEHNLRLKNELNITLQEKRQLENKLYATAQEKQKQEEHNRKLEDELNTTTKKKQQQEEYNFQLEYKLDMIVQEKQQLEQQIIALESNIQNAIQECNSLTNWGLYKFSHFLHRTKHQFFQGNLSEKKKYIKWICNYLRGKGTDLEIKYKPVHRVTEILEDREFSFSEDIKNADSNQYLLKEEYNLLSALPDALRNELARDYTQYDVIIFAVIDYNFRHQRPQHFATRFASNGHRVFYVNANFFRQDSIITEQKNLYIVDLFNDEYNTIYAMDGHTTLPWMKEKLDTFLFEQGIRDAIVIVDYPNWVEGAEYLKKKYGFKIVTDYMDDYTGFLNTTEDFLKDNCTRLLRCSDMVAASSQFLYEVAARYTDKGKIELIHNGTEVEHFYQAVQMKTSDKEKKVIGYYGAVAHWFAWEKVCFLAEKFPECDIVIVGEVTEHREKLEQYSNIILLGEKPYRELPKYLVDFDVCLIPFDTSTDLIKATNPVKFYEYLSAGKKIVATEIPELLPYRDKYVYMSNENDTFAKYVQLCLEGKDCLKGREECIAFARENDWQKRYEAFEKGCTKHIPKVSVVVLTYNNLALNKQCIDSILQKTAYGNYELIVVDNASTDGTVEYLKELQAQAMTNIKIFLNDQNKGFAGGNNVGIAASTGDYVLLLNNDTVVSRGWMTALVKHLENNLKYGMCNPVTNNIGNESKIKVSYHNMQEMHEFAYAVTTSKMNEEYMGSDRMPLFSTLIRRELIEKVGMLDELYEIGMFEDDDYTEMAKMAGYDITIAEDAFVHHVGNGTFKKLEQEEYNTIFKTNQTIYENKWKKKWTLPKYREGIDWDTNRDMGI